MQARNYGGLQILEVMEMMKNGYSEKWLNMFADILNVEYEET